MRCAPSAVRGSPRSSARGGWRRHPRDHSPTRLSLTQPRAAKDLTRMRLVSARTSGLPQSDRRSNASGRWVYHDSRHEGVGLVLMKVGAIGLARTPATRLGGHVL